MDRLLSMLSFYDLVGYVLTGGVAASGLYVAVADIPDQAPGTVVTLGLVAAAYVAGHLVQGVSVLWEGSYWRARGGWPSAVRVGATKGAYDGDTKALIDSRLAEGRNVSIESAAVQTKFAVARADLRSRGADHRAELMNALYAFSRGLATAFSVAALALLISSVARDWECDRLIGSASCAVAAVLFLVRFHRFGYYFADQVWRDFAAEPRQPV